MNCFIMIKDKTGINDTFTFSYQRETCLNLNESSCRSGFSLCFLQGESQLQDYLLATPSVCLIDQEKYLFNLCLYEAFTTWLLYVKAFSKIYML